MDYFYDHQTDKLSITVGDFAEYSSSQMVVPGAVLHTSANRRPIAVEISGARAVVNVAGLVTFEERRIEATEMQERLNKSECGRRIWRALVANAVSSLRMVAAS